ncbi:glycosyltransferase family 2 protein [Lachnospiraceae bacterium LCP25S3_G4]
MKVKYYFDLITYNILEKEKVFAVSGWCFEHRNDNLTYKVLVNGKNSSFLIKKILRQDVLQKYCNYKIDVDVGFKIKLSIPLEKDIHKIQIIAYNKDVQKEIYCITKRKLEGIADRNTLLYAIDNITAQEKEDKFLLCLQGWAHTLNRGNEVMFKVRDANSDDIIYAYRMINRMDLYKAGIVKRKESDCGFLIYFEGQRNETYHFSMSDGTSQVTKSFDILSLQKKEKRDGKIHLLRIIISCWSIKNVRRGLKFLYKRGFCELLERIKQGENPIGLPYSKWYQINHITESELKKQRQCRFKNEPKISIIVPVYNTPIPFLIDMVESVKRQSYTNWELCIGDGSEGNYEIEKIFEDLQKHDSRILYKNIKDNKGISGNTNEALELATGMYIGLLDHDDVLEPNALYEVVVALNHDNYDVIYTDEDKVSTDLIEHLDPNFKPDYSPDLFYSHNYITHFFVVKKEIVNRVGKFRSAFDGAQDYDFMFRCIEISDKIKHIPQILYNWRIHASSVAGNPASKMYAYEAGRRAIEEHYQRVGISARVEHAGQELWGMYHTIYSTIDNPLVSIIIPNKDHVEDLDLCIQSIYNKSNYQNFEIILIENNSSKETIQYYDTLKKKYKCIKLVNWKGEFNYAAINNFGVKFAKGEYLLFLNNDTELIDGNAISELLGCCMREDVGVVGAKLLYQDDTVQHAGIVIGFGGFAGHVFNGIDRDDYGYMVRPRINCNYNAVTAACMMVKRDVFEKVCGFTEEFKVGLNDVDFCLKVRETGKLVVYNAFSLWYHYESKSRGYEDTPEKLERFEGEVQLFRKKWGNILKNGDPYYNKNFPIEYGPFRLG